AAVDESIHQLEFRLSESQRDAESLKEKRQGFEVQQSVQLEEIKATIEQKRQSLSAWQRFVFFFKKLDEEKKLAEQKKKLDQLRVRNKADLDAIAAETLKMNQELNVLRSERAQIESAFAQLVPLQDGNIIGNGRSDFTRLSHAYRFTVDDQK
ncbi:hypothetical protein, partial [Escherichia coli]|uniref:hypothetical protein n=1 Tax=Escherichia coli TaxID=562 RepID=UPI00137B8FF2